MLSRVAVGTTALMTLLVACGPDFVVNGGAGGGAGVTTSGGGNGAGGEKPVICNPGELVDCYAGPEGTADVGPCKTGQGACNEDGTGIIGCMGEVLPRPESCGTLVDSDCSGDAGDRCASQTVYVDVAGYQTRSATVDSDGAVIVAGSLSGDLDPNPNGIWCNNGNQDAYIGKFDASGNHVWSWCGGSSGVDTVHEVAADGTDIYAAGSYRYDIDVGQGFGIGTALNTEWGGFIVKRDTNGGVVWNERLSGEFAFAAARGVAVSPDGVLATGLFSDTIDILGATLSQNGGGNTVWAGRLDKNDGTPDWSVALGSGCEDARVGALEGGDAIVVMVCSGDFDLLGETFEDDGRSLFVVRLDGEDGEAKWIRMIGGNGAQQDPHIAVAGEDIVVTGTTNAVVDFGDGKKPAIGNVDVMVAKLDAESGAILWGRHFGVPGAVQREAAVAIDSQGRIILAGGGEGLVDYGGGVIDNEDESGFVLARYLPDGTYDFSRDFDESSFGQFGGVAIGAGDTIHAFGGTWGSVNLGDGTVGDRGVVIGRFEP